MSGGAITHPCWKCGSRQSASARYCSKCGALLQLDETAEFPLSQHDSVLAREAVTSSPAPGEAMFVVRHGPIAGQTFRIGEPLTTIGRDPASDVFLNDVTVSRRHAEVHRSQDDFAIRDVGSLNGTYLGSERVDEAQITHGAQVRIGRFVLIFLHQPGHH